MKKLSFISAKEQQQREYWVSANNGRVYLETEQRHRPPVLPVVARRAYFLLRLCRAANTQDRDDQNVTYFCFSIFSSNTCI